MRILTSTFYLVAASLTIMACGDDKAPAPTDTASTDTAQDVATEDVAPADAADDVALEDSTPEDVAVEDTSPPPVCEEAPVPVLGAQAADNTEYCVSCVNAACCAEMTACADNAACLSARTCFATCPAGANTCIDDCVAANEGYLDTNAPYITCRTDNCAHQCALDSCVGQVVWTEPAVESRTMVNTFTDFQEGGVLAGLTVKVCAKTDADCEDPLSQGTTDDEGKVTLDLPTAVGGLAVYLAVTGEGYLPTDFWYVEQDPETRLDSGNLSWRLISESTANILTGFVGATLDPTRGSVTFIAVACDRTALAGLAVTADTTDEDSTTLYLRGLLPTVELPATHNNGTGAILNLPPGPVSLTGTGLDGRIWSQQTVNVRAGWMVGTNMSPTPVVAAE